MIIHLTKNLSDVITEDLVEMTQAVDPQAADPRFTWTANWTNIWDGRRANNTLVLVNNATRFVVAIYQLKRQDLKSKNIKDKIQTAIANTLVEMNVNFDVALNYLRLAGKVEFVQNRNRKAASWVTHAGHECSFYTARKYDRGKIVYDDTVGAPANIRTITGSSIFSGEFVPFEAMKEMLNQLTGLPIYKYRAYELEISLDLQVYKAVRRVIVPATIRLRDLHKLIQRLFNWKGYHLHDFAIYKDDQYVPELRLVPYEEDLEWDGKAVLIEDHRLSEFLPKGGRMVYTYDLGDNWKHEIQLRRVIDDYDKQSPYLLMAEGQGPPEDVGGIGGFIEFREIMLDPSHPEHEENKMWAGYWQPELSEWQKGPRFIELLWP